MNPGDLVRYDEWIGIVLCEKFLRGESKRKFLTILWNDGKITDIETSHLEVIS